MYEFSPWSLTSFRLLLYPSLSVYLLIVPLSTGSGSILEDRASRASPEISIRRTAIGKLRSDMGAWPSQHGADWIILG